MSDEKGQAIPMRFETAPDHVVVYVDSVNVASAGHEVVLSAYQTIPGYPTEGSVSEVIRTRRATLILSPAHALSLGKILVTQAGDAESPAGRPAVEA